MMDWVRGPSRIVIALPVFSARNLYIVFGSLDREAEVPSDRPQARAEARAVCAGEGVAGA